MGETPAGIVLALLLGALAVGFIAGFVTGAFFVDSYMKLRK